MLENGYVKEIGSYYNLMNNNGPFSHFVSDFFKNNENKDDEKAENKKGKEYFC